MENLAIDGEPFVVIRNVDAMPPFLMSIVSNGNCWLFAGSNSPFTAGRTDSDHAIFPYRTADKILNQPGDGGVRSLFLVEQENGFSLWEPWQSSPSAYRVQRNLFKSAYGTSVMFEEINHDLGLRFAWRLAGSEKYGWIRFCTLENLLPDTARIRLLDGWNQIIPPGVTQELYEKYSYLAAAYMRHEQQAGLGIYTLNSGITDRAEPCESLRAAVAWSVGLPVSDTLLSGRQIASFRQGTRLRAEPEVRGEFGAFLVAAAVEITAGSAREWFSAVDTGLDHAALKSLRPQLARPSELKRSVEADVLANRNSLRRRIAAADGLQATADAAASTHHFANTLFNCMRGGTLPDNYRFPSADFADFLRGRNRELAARQGKWLLQLPEQLDLQTLRSQSLATADAQLIRLAREYLPLTFSRRHGDPSRPWNKFSIRTRDECGNVIFDYQGNWRDIFQNWESLAQSYPDCLESMVAIFLNASTADGYNPYRITRAGIDWEVEDPHDPWSHIGYWGDHQIIYLLRLLEGLEQYQPGKLVRSLGERAFASANVPYEIKGFADLLRDPRNSIHFNQAKHRQLLARAQELGNDAKLFADANGDVRLFTLAEKLLVPLLAKLSNLVPEGGIWLNTQRPEWNDANNALAGWGLSVVTVGHLRRYLNFLSQLFAGADGQIELSTATARFARQVGAILSPASASDPAARFDTLGALGQAGEQHRQAVYAGQLGPDVKISFADVRHLLANALQAVDATLRANRRADGMYHSYNLLEIVSQQARIAYLDLMLEGQVSVLGAGLLSPDEALQLLQALRHSDLFRADQHSYLLYPDRVVKPFLDRNSLPANWREKVPAVAALVDAGDNQIITSDVSRVAHFQADLTNAKSLEARLDKLSADARWQEAVAKDRAALLALWEEVFSHAAFTGRSGSMFAFEGLGSIYWHMIAKLLVAAEECHHQAAVENSSGTLCARLRTAYYDIRRGLGFTKSPEVYGAFPSDPYSHTPRHLGAQQPGMTGQVKEEILTRRAELGVRVEQGGLCFEPRLLRRSEFFNEPHSFPYVDVHGVEQIFNLPSGSLAFTCCQVPVSYEFADDLSILVEQRDGSRRVVAGGKLSAEDSRQIFSRSGNVVRLTVKIPRSRLPD